MEWNDINALTPQELNEFNEEYKEEIYEALILLEIDIITADINKLKNIFKISQELLKFKDEQVKYLLTEFDAVARKQGIEEAKIIQSLKNEIKTLKSSSYRATPDLDLKRENEELKVKIKHHKINTRTQAEEIHKLKKDILNVQEELIHTRQDAQLFDRDEESQTESEASSKYERFTENIKQKNKHITDLLSDIEVVEKENIILKEKLGTLKKEIQDATRHINHMTEEFSKLKDIQISDKEKIQSISTENKDLRNEIDNLTQENQQQEIDLEKTTVTLNSKVDDLKKLLEEKENEIESLQITKAELEIKLSKARNKTKGPPEIISKKNEQILELEKQLVEATAEIEKNAILFENLSKTKSVTILDTGKDNESIIQDLKSHLKVAHARCKDLQIELDIAEQDAQSRTKQLSDLINQLRKYEEGQYGFFDVLQEMQDCRKQIDVRDKQITDLIRTTNTLQSSYGELEYENVALREKLGLPLDEVISSKEIAAKQRKQKKLLNNLQNQIEILEDENLHLNAELRKHKKLLADLTQTNTVENQSSAQNEEHTKILSQENDVQTEYKQKYTEMIEENEALRKGMHEILQSIRTNKENGNYEIKSESLEQLLQLLDARHISGWYHPAMRLQAEVHTLQGANDELRKQMLATKQEVIKSSASLKQAAIEIEQLRKQNKDNAEINTAQNITIPVDSNIITFHLPSQLTTSSAEVISKLNTHLLLVLNEYDKEVENNKKLSENLESTKQELNILRGQLGTLYKQFISEKKKLETLLEETLLEKKVLSETVIKLEDKFGESDKSTEHSDTRNKLQKQYGKAMRSCIYLEENEKRLIAENTKLKSEMCFASSAATERIKSLETIQNDLQYKIGVLEKTLCDSVPKRSLEITNKTVHDITIKYQELLDNEKKFEENNNVEYLRKEVELLITEKDALFTELMKIKLKVNLSVYANEEVTTLNKKITTSELNENTERQHANHLNSLYELVKEQLRKTEERCFEVENYHKVLLSENLKLQIREKDSQDKLINFVTREDYSDLENKYQQKENAFHELKNKYDRLLNRNNIKEAELKTIETFKTTHDIEFINLKHLVLDLQSNSDEKALIARLSSEVVLARVCDNDSRNKLEILKNNLKQMNDVLLEKDALLEKSYSQIRKIQNNNDLKLRNLEQIIQTLRLQYLGCSPISTKERGLQMLQQMNIDKYETFNILQSMQEKKSNLVTLQEQLNIEIKNTADLKNLSQTDRGAISESLFEWYKDKNMLQADECKHRRNAEFKEIQLQQLTDRLKTQDNQMIKLEEEYLKLNNMYMNNAILVNTALNSNKIKLDESNSSQSQSFTVEKVDTGTDAPIIETKLFNTTEIQTENTIDDNKKIYEEMINALREDIEKNKRLISLKDDNLKKQEAVISDFEKNIDILKLKVAENATSETRQQINVIDEVDLQEYNALKLLVESLQVTITQKEDVINKYENLLKQNRDEHSLAASRFQEEIKHLQNVLQQQNNLYQELKISKANQSSDTLPNKAALEQYVNQVHALEDHMAELETNVSGLNIQLQASREESVRWRTLANNRLNAVESLRKELDDRYQEEISTYRSDYDKYKDENISLKQDLTKAKMELNEKDVNINQQLHEKDTIIHELNTKIMYLHNDLKISSEDSQTMLSSQFSDLKLTKELLETEHEALKKRFEQVLSREKAAKAEINNLKSQLIKRPIVPVKSDRSDKSIKEQLQKKIYVLEKELSDVSQKLEKETALNETRKLKIAEDFTLWDKQKRWQQTAEKYKEKLSAKSEELENLQRNYSSAKSLISRLEREKHILEGKFKAFKSVSATSSTSNLGILEHENVRLKNDVDILSAKLEMQHYHAGGLGAAMLEEKLEAQERKIAVLELTAKGTIEVTAELERLNSQVALLQKANLRLEAENLQINVDLKKVTSEAPFLREQIQHLERYIEVLKSEQHVVTNSGDHFQPQESYKKVVELEKTIVSLKRLVEKLQNENKRLQIVPSTPTNNKKVTSEKSQTEINKLRKENEEKTQKIAELENSLTVVRKRNKFLEEMLEKKQFDGDNLIMEEYRAVKAQLDHKNQLLDKIKILLQKAALKEKFLQDEIKQLKQQLSQGSSHDFKNDGDSYSS